MPRKHRNFWMKDKMSKRKKHFDVAQFFEDCGYKVYKYPNNRYYTQFYADGGVFSVRSVDNTLQFGVRETFDRWANSVDFITGLPTSELQAIKKLSAVIDLYEANHFDEGWGAERHIGDTPPVMKNPRYSEDKNQMAGNPKTKKMWRTQRASKGGWR